MIGACVICLQPFEAVKPPDGIQEARPVGTVVCSNKCAEDLNRKIEAHEFEAARALEARRLEEQEAEVSEAEKARRSNVIDVDSIPGAEPLPGELATGIQDQAARIAVLRAVREMVGVAQTLENPKLPPKLAAAAGMFAVQLLVEAYGENLPDYGSEA